MTRILEWILGRQVKEAEDQVAWNVLAANLRAFQPKDRAA